jgi:hypothetical protein
MSGAGNKLIRKGLLTLVLPRYGGPRRQPAESFPVREMFSAMLLTISIVALMQFAAYYWRSILAGVAAQPISAEVLSAVSVDHGMLNGRDFQVVAKLYELTPNLQKKSSGIGLVSAYFHVIHTIGQLAAGRMASLANWAERERVLCVRYAAVQVDRRLQSNLALAAAIRSC